MANSWYQSIELTCQNCSRTFASDLWMIIDIQERPDLVRKAMEDTLHVAFCPACGYGGNIDSPFLLFRTGSTPMLLFFPAYDASPDEIIDTANFLQEQLRTILGYVWREKWHNQGFIVTPEQRRDAFASILGSPSQPDVKKNQRR